MPCPFLPLVPHVTSPTAVIATIGRCNALSPFATAETRKLDSPKRSVKLTTRGIRIPLPSPFLVLFAPRLLHRSHPSNSTRLEIPHRLRKTFDPIFVIPSSDERAVSFLLSLSFADRDFYGLHAWSAGAILRRADGVKIIVKDVWLKLHVRDMIKLMIYTCICIALHHMKLIRISLVKKSLRGVIRNERYRHETTAKRKESACPGRVNRIITKFYTRTTECGFRSNCSRIRINVARTHFAARLSEALLRRPTQLTTVDVDAICSLCVLIVHSYRPAICNCFCCGLTNRATQSCKLIFI